MYARIFKYSLDVDHRQMVMMPEDARPLCVVEQNEQLVMYAEVPIPVAPAVPRIFRVVTTGDEYETEYKSYVGSATLAGWFIAHAFEVQEGGYDPIDFRHAEDFLSIKQEQDEKAVA